MNLIFIFNFYLKFRNNLRKKPNDFSFRTRNNFTNFYNDHSFSETDFNDKSKSAKLIDEELLFIPMGSMEEENLNLHNSDGKKIIFIINFFSSFS